MSNIAIMKAVLSQRYNYSLQHLDAAILFYKCAKRIEVEHQGEKLGSFFEEIRSYVTGSVIMTASALEAKINEDFTNVKDGITVISDFDVHTYFQNWNNTVRESTLKKHEIYIGLQEKLLDTSSEEYLKASKLSTIRNELIHYKPQWDEEKTPENKLEKIFIEISNEITFSPFILNNAPYFPMRCMTNSFAHWAIITTLNFIEWFDKEAGIENRFGQFRSKLEEDLKNQKYS